MNAQELSISLASEIAAKHSEALSVADKARDNIEAALEAAAAVGILIDKAKEQYKARFHEWIRQQVPTLSVVQAENYHSLFKLRRRRTCLAADPRQLKWGNMLGDEDLESEGGNSKGQRADSGRWIKWAGHIAQHFREVDSTRPIETWESFERKALADTLEPMVALYKRAGGSYLAP